MLSQFAFVLKISSKPFPFLVHIVLAYWIGSRPVALLAEGTLSANAMGLQSNAPCANVECLKMVKFLQRFGFNWRRTCEL